MAIFFNSLLTIFIYQVLVFAVDNLRRPLLLPATTYIDSMGHLWRVAKVDTDMDIFMYSSYSDHQICIETKKTCPFVTCGIKKFSTSGWKLYE